MAKKVVDVDLGYIIGSMAPNPENYIEPHPKKKENKGEQKDEPKVEQPKKRKSRTDDYKGCFLKKNDIVAREGKTINIRKEYLKIIQAVIHSISKDEISASNYIDNVLSNHFDNYEDEITELDNQNKQSIFQKNK